ncbi:hypothetical protein TSOC_003740 [Tetrabaena socialis]|uniref:Uncharacterized protein n=1 Tax=Tetrabaena socialis TaxID=47790 RepID=A0A2J8AAS3_9CHLO|nr:hypothetical protein TSOC_003740 [Tetrabaena socialis]|eukprot:PNH09615.1 hypothetical protein TSOC_003740 [Tetrabaena socialis]
MASSVVVLPPSPNWYAGYGSHLVSVLPSHQLVAYGGHSSVVLACAETRTVQRLLSCGTARVTAVVLAPEAAGQQLVAAGCEDGSLRCWDWGSGEQVRSHRKKSPEVTALAALVSSPLEVVAGDFQGGITLWCPGTGDRRSLGQPGHTLLSGRVNCLAACTTAAAARPSSGAASSTAAHGGSPVGGRRQSLVVAGMSDGSLQLLDVDLGRVLLSVRQAHRGGVHTVQAAGLPYLTSSHAPAAGAAGGPPPAGGAGSAAATVGNGGAEEPAAEAVGVLEPSDGTAPAAAQDADGGGGGGSGAAASDDAEAESAAALAPDLWLLTSGEDGLAKVWSLPALLAAAALAEAAATAANEAPSAPRPLAPPPPEPLAVVWLPQPPQDMQQGGMGAGGPAARRPWVPSTLLPGCDLGGGAVGELCLAMAAPWGHLMLYSVDLATGRAVLSTRLRSHGRTVFTLHAMRAPPAAAAAGGAAALPRLRLVSTSQDRSLVVTDLRMQPSAAAQAAAQAVAPSPAAAAAPTVAATAAAPAANPVPEAGVAAPAVELAVDPATGAAGAEEEALEQGEAQGPPLVAGRADTADSWRPRHRPQQQPPPSPPPEQQQRRRGADEEEGEGTMVAAAAGHAGPGSAAAVRRVQPRGGTVWWRLTGLGGYPYSLELRGGEGPGGPHPGAVLAVGCGDRTLRYLAFGCADGSVGLLDVPAQQSRVFAVRHSGPVTNLVWVTPRGGAAVAGVGPGSTGSGSTGGGGAGGGEVRGGNAQRYDDRNRRQQPQQAGLQPGSSAPTTPSAGGASPLPGGTPGPSQRPPSRFVNLGGGGAGAPGGGGAGGGGQQQPAFIVAKGPTADGGFRGRGRAASVATSDGGGGPETTGADGAGEQPSGAGELTPGGMNGQQPQGNQRLNHQQQQQRRGGGAAGNSGGGAAPPQHLQAPPGPEPFLLSCGGEGRLLRWPGPSLDPYGAEPGLGPSLAGAKPVDVGSLIEAMATAALGPFAGAAAIGAAAALTHAGPARAPIMHGGAAGIGGGGATPRGGLPVTSVVLHPRRGWLAVAFGGGCGLVVVEPRVAEQQYGQQYGPGGGNRGDGVAWRLVAAAGGAGKAGGVGPELRFMQWADDEGEDGDGGESESEGGGESEGGADAGVAAAVRVESERGAAAANAAAAPPKVPCTALLVAMYGKSSAAVYGVTAQYTAGGAPYGTVGRLLDLTAEAKQVSSLCWLGRRCLALGADDGGVQLWALPRLPAAAAQGPGQQQQQQQQQPAVGAVEAVRVRTLCGQHAHHDSVTCLSAARLPPAAAAAPGGAAPSSHQRPRAAAQPLRARRGRRPPPPEARPLLPDGPDLSRPEVAAAAHDLILQVAEALYPEGGAGAGGDGADADDVADCSGGGGGGGGGVVADPVLAAHLLHDVELLQLQAPQPDSQAAQPPGRQQQQQQAKPQQPPGRQQHVQQHQPQQQRRPQPAAGLPVELRYVASLWADDLGGALALAAGVEGMANADMVALAAAGGRAAWEAAARLYAGQMAAGCCEAALALVAVGDRARAAALFQEAGMEWEAAAVLGGL